MTDYFRICLAGALAATYPIDDELHALGRKVVIKVSAGVNRERVPVGNSGPRFPSPVSRLPSPVSRLPSFEDL